MLKSEFSKRGLQAVLAAALALVGQAPGGEAYYTGFENFAVGEDTLVNTDGWVGTYVGAKLHGTMSEDQHKVKDIGNAAFIGGFATIATNTATTGTTPVFPYVRRPVNLDPLALGQEVATFGVTFGIKDSTSASLIGFNRYKRDNFEFLVYSKAGALLGGLQFDNTTLDSLSGLPRGLIYRLAWNNSAAAFEYNNTGFIFLPQAMESLQFRINYRTNRWTATLGGVPLFQDLTFYTGSQAKDLGYVMVKMGVGLSSYYAPTKTTTIQPGDNYLLFDDFAVRTDPVTTTLNVSKTDGGAPTINWNEEASYSYRLQYSGDGKAWLDFAGSIHTATVTGDARFTDPTSPVPTRRFYRVKRTYP
jgi:hypothetical protein